MTLKKMRKCPYHGKEPLAELHPEIQKNPSRCPFCYGKLEYEVNVSLYYYKGKFSGINWNNISEYHDDIYAYFRCECGDEISLDEGGDTEACSCGRLYRLDLSIKVDETHIGETDWIIEESNKSEIRHSL